jgi:methionine synthase I (cobalamin-dependent)
VCASSLALLALQTNNSTKTRAVNALKLAEHGITASAEEVVSSAYVTARYMADSGLVAGDKVYVIGEVRPSSCSPPPSLGPLMCDGLLSTCRYSDFLLARNRDTLTLTAYFGNLFSLVLM